MTTSSDDRPRHAQQPYLNVFLLKGQTCWSLMIDYHCWCPPNLGDFFGTAHEISPIAAPDFDALDERMWRLDLPYGKQVAKFGGGELWANGRAALELAKWLEELVTSAPAP